jgi:hypothetical protein
VQLIRIRLMTQVNDPLERLAMIREEMQEARALKPISARELAEMQDVLPSAAMTLAAAATVPVRGEARGLHEHGRPDGQPRAQPHGDDLRRQGHDRSGLRPADDAGPGVLL